MNEELIISRVTPLASNRDLAQVEPDTQSVMQLEIPPWAEGYEVSSTEGGEGKFVSQPCSGVRLYY
jgi:hypothetical protein